MRSGAVEREVLACERVGRYFRCRLAVDWSHEVEPGQFMMVHVPHDSERPLGRPLCVSDRGEGWVEFTAALVGAGTKAISAYTNPGDKLRVLGPLGNGFRFARSHKRIALVGGGVGIAELVVAAKVLHAKGRPAAFFAGARTAEDLIALDDIRSLSSTLEVTTEDGSMGRTGLVTAPLREFLQSGALDLVAACGPHGMLVAVARLADEFGVESLVATEERMACGIGACFGCTVPLLVNGEIRMARACSEGPVFRGKAFLGGLTYGK
jgi:dihydroorotate dehydrogenase electron transfer subunit